MKKMKRCLFSIIIATSCFLVSSCDLIKHEHQYTEWTVIEEATCQKKGQEQKTCSCGEKFTRTIAKKYHQYNSFECIYCGKNKFGD